MKKYDLLTEKLKEELKKNKMLLEDDDDIEDDEDDQEIDFEDDDDDNDDDQDEFDSTETNTNDSFCELTCKILHSRNQAHVFHLGVTGEGSFAAHKALNDYYDGVLDLYDGLVESYQGKYGLLKNFKTYKIENYKSIKNVIKYFENLVKDIQESRDCCEDSYIQNQIDTVQELIYSTVYKLKFLK